MPRKTCILFLFLGRMILLMASTLLGSIFSPYLAIMCPNSLSFLTKKWDLLGFRDKPYFLHFSKSELQMLEAFLIGLRNKVISSKSRLLQNYISSQQILYPFPFEKWLQYLRDQKASWST